MCDRNETMKQRSQFSLTYCKLQFDVMFSFPFGQESHVWLPCLALFSIQSHNILKSALEYH